MTDLSLKSSSRAGYTDHVNGYSGAFSWWRHALYSGKWLVVCHETSFAKETIAVAVTDDFGNLVRVPA